MTAKQLHEMTAPLFAKHPSAKPDWLQCPCGFEKDFWLDAKVSPTQENISQDVSALIIQGHLVEWRAKHSPHGCNINHEPTFPDHSKWVVNGEYKPTLLESLIAACMEIEK